MPRILVAAGFIIRQQRGISEERSGSPTEVQISLNSWMTNSSGS